MTYLFVLGLETLHEILCLIATQRHEYRPYFIEFFFRQLRWSVVFYVVHNLTTRNY
jgi:hypothetical protein